MPADSPSSDVDAPTAVDVQLDHASVMTTDLDAAVSFYVDLIGLSLRTVEDDPVRDGRHRALLTDDHGQDVVELIEMEEMKHPSVPGRGGIHHLGFSLPSREWHSLRSRLDAADHAYEEVKGRLFVRDADGLVLEIEEG
ncbi:VOC family protein [Salinibacter ruber]|uniref:Glyoxylase I family protein n=1 Tax=Salinibacter ruber TaxID=146919 RepID=A0A9X2UJ50_9BACT|nr:VOC family protein [Salinibacter ruber]MCS3614077.1 glyoxylase I family protein [Salinibacter ruber]MCS3647038.1 glyoxylase I family protein [Salinibacter ruber]MCS3674349.1 glyoxylase I family protein [Salinibacter ruber]MCS3783486.1 glyoxylase I family protein [Salinibacter ruber]MCS4035104.1 glyoxylase I family protein [Salinibacter ruber]